MKQVVFDKLNDVIVAVNDAWKNADDSIEKNQLSHIVDILLKAQVNLKIIEFNQQLRKR